MPEAHAGRLLDHVHLRVRDVEASKRFYAGALEPLGLDITGEGDGCHGPVERSAESVVFTWEST